MAQMTVSELIKALQKIEVKYGDAGVIAAPEKSQTFVTIVERIAMSDDGDILLTEA